MYCDTSTPASAAQLVVYVSTTGSEARGRPVADDGGGAGAVAPDVVGGALATSG